MGDTTLFPFLKALDFSKGVISEESESDFLKVEILTAVVEANVVEKFSGS